MDTLTEKPWFLAEQQKIIVDCVVEELRENEISPNYVNVYGTELLDKGQLSDVQYIAPIKKEDSNKLKPKNWIKKILLQDIYRREGEYFSVRIVTRLAILQVYDEATEMWERLEL